MKDPGASVLLARVPPAAVPPGNDHDRSHRFVWLRAAHSSRPHARADGSAARDAGCPGRRRPGVGAALGRPVRDRAQARCRIDGRGLSRAKRRSGPRPGTEARAARRVAADAAAFRARGTARRPAPSSERGGHLRTRRGRGRHSLHHDGARRGRDPATARAAHRAIARGPRRAHRAAAVRRARSPAPAGPRASRHQARKRDRDPMRPGQDHRFWPGRARRRGARARRHRRDAALHLARGDRPIPAALERIVLDCLAKEAASRPPSAAKLDERLAACGAPMPRPSPLAARVLGARRRAGRRLGTCRAAPELPDDAVRACRSRSRSARGALLA